MGRPAKPADQKRQLLSVRFDPEVRAALERATERTGRSLGAEIERRAALLANCDEETLDLLEQVVSEIAALELRNRGKRWHRDLRTWSGVAEMFANGPIRTKKPNNEVDQEAQAEAWGPLNSISDRQRELVGELNDLGVTVKPERQDHGGLFPSLLGRYSNRDLEKAAIEAIPSPDMRAVALERFAELLKLDEEHQAARAKWEAEMRPYWDAENQGRQDYRDHLHEQAVLRRDRGESFDFAHLMKWFVAWR